MLIQSQLEMQTAPVDSQQPDSAGSDASRPISLAAFAGPGRAGMLLRLVAPVLDRVLGIRALARRYDELARRYDEFEMRGMDKHAFVESFLDQQGIRIRGAEQVRAAVPDTGPAIVVCNHPYGGIEGVILARILGSRRADLKIMANVGLGIVGELSDFFIFTNPLRPSSRGNVTSIIQCRRHLESGGLLVLFPAGMVSFYQHDLGRITDASWNRLEPAARPTRAADRCQRN
jgi:putative hemolysin